MGALRVQLCVWWRWGQAIGSSYIDCDWGEQNVQDYGSDVNHPVGCMEGNVAPPAGTPASCTRWQVSPRSPQPCNSP